MSFVPDDLEPIQAVRDRIGENALGIALASERLEAHYITDDGGVCEISAGYWCSKHARASIESGKYISDLGLPFDGAPIYIFIDEEDEEYVTDQATPKNKGGRPSADWDAVFIAAACYVATNGIPKTRTEFIARLQDQLGAKAPGDTQMKERIGPLYNAVKKALG